MDSVEIKLLEKLAFEDSVFKVILPPGQG